MDQTDLISQVMARLQKADGASACWDACVEIARELGADALNLAKFNGQDFAPIWMRVSTHEQGGLEEYIKNDYMSVDPILVPRARDTLAEVDHISLANLIAAGGLTDKEAACFEHLKAHGQSDYLTFRLKETESTVETLLVFSCSATGADTLKAVGLDRLTVIANLFALHVTPPTPKQASGKVPLLYDFLTPREQDVLRLLAQGKQNDEIAHMLGLSEVTIRMHTTSAKKKMHATTRAQALALALVRGLITL